ncbi:hypothetical protein BC567DRAFT_214438 [Phyllosticta citribraziliensis]
MRSRAWPSHVKTAPLIRLLTLIHSQQQLSGQSTKDDLWPTLFLLRNSQISIQDFVLSCLAHMTMLHSDTSLDCQCVIFTREGQTEGMTYHTLHIVHGGSAAAPLCS